MPLYLSESDVETLLTAADAVPVIEACFRRMAPGVVDSRPRQRLTGDGGTLAVMAAADGELGVAGVKCYAIAGGGGAAAVSLFSLGDGSLQALIAADALGRLRTGAASAVAALHLAKDGASSLGIIGCGRQAESQLAAVRAALPAVERVVAWCRTPERLEAFCARTGAAAAEDAQAAAACDVVVTVTTSRDPVLRGDWLLPGALVCAVGANHPSRRELDNVALQRATFVCCDSVEQARLESADLIEPVASGVLDWLEVHELQEVVAGEVRGRSTPSDIAVFKSNGLAAWDVALAAEAVRRARERGVGREL